MNESVVRLDPAGLERMQETFLTRIRDFGDFADEASAYWMEERAYKDEMVHLFHQIFAPELFPAGHDEASATRVIQAVTKMLTTKLRALGGPQNVIGWRYQAFLRAMEPEERLLFARSLGDVLYGPGESPERVGRFTEAMWPVFKRTLGGNPYAVTRLVPTFFLMLQNPTRDVAVRTDLFERAGRALLSDWLLRYRPFGEQDYRDVLDFTHAVRRELLSWGWMPRDLIDVHSFLFVATRTDEEFRSDLDPRPGEKEGA
jgi:hypothetical protein